jgi:uncharacterized coiled-coil protein SlyX
MFMKRQVAIMVSIATVSFLIGTMFSTNHLAIGGKPNPIWEAIYDLQARVNNLDNTVTEQQAQISKLQNEIAILNASLIELQSKVNALETRMPKKDFTSISPMAFLPWDAYQRTMTYIELLGVDYYAFVQLPHGVILTKMIVALHDENDYRSLNVTLYRRNQIMAQVSSGSGNGGDLVVYDDTIDYATVDCQNYTYCIEISTDSHDQPGIGLYWVVLEYEYQA